MKQVPVILTLLFTLIALSTVAEPIQLHPENPHYFQYKGKPTVLITSAEHYGAVLNLDFDYITYLNEMKSKGMNLTRVFSGAYCEVAADFGIEKNTLAPFKNKLICPWGRSQTPGYAMGGAKFDLNSWDPDYFKRLKDFLHTAAKKGVIVEYVLFCPFYEDRMWNVSPMNAKNNINGYSDVKRTDVYALKDKKLTDLQIQMTQKVVAELKNVDNLYYEICNEPYFGGVTEEWQALIAKTIAEAERDFPTKHLIAKNIANGSKEVETAFEHVDIYNYHYAFPPEAVKQNYKLNKVIGYDETGFAGESDTTYRSHAWAFLMAGGAVYNNLDYSFTSDYENGIAKVKAPGGGSAALRSQLNILQDFMQSLDFIHMRPNPQIIKKAEGAKKIQTWCLEKPGEQYGIYILHGEQAELTLALPQGSFTAEWIHPLSGEILHEDILTSTGGSLSIQSPAYVDDIALRIVKK